MGQGGHFLIKALCSRGSRISWLKSDFRLSVDGFRLRICENRRNLRLEIGCRWSVVGSRVQRCGRMMIRPYERLGVSAREDQLSIPGSQ